MTDQNNEQKEPKELKLGTAGALILTELASRGAGHGWDLIGRLDGRVSASTLYENLKRLRDLGLVDWRTEDGPGRGPPRKVYFLIGDAQAVETRFAHGAEFN